MKWLRWAGIGVGVVTVILAVWVATDSILHAPERVDVPPPDVDRLGLALDVEGRWLRGDRPIRAALDDRPARHDFGRARAKRALVNPSWTWLD